MENRTNQAGQQPAAAAQNNPSAGSQGATSGQAKSQSPASSQGQSGSTAQNQGQSGSSSQGGSNGILGGLTSSLSNIQMPQAVKDFGATCARSYSGLSTTQKVVGGAALALGASYWAAKSNGWVGQGKAAKKSKSNGRQA